ncbi:MAG: TGS domain-containing protein [Candidatus Saccharimonadales bacterium]
MQRLNQLLERYNPQSAHPEYMRALLLAVEPEAVPDFLQARLARLRLEPGVSDAAVALTVLAPLANQLNFQALKHELEDTAFKIIHPEQYNLTCKLLRQNAADTQKPLLKFIKALEDKLAQVGVDGIEVSGRTKQPYSLYKKLRKSGSIHDVHDLLAVRVIVANESDCYRVLDVINQEFQPSLERFKDYIKRPKPNGYQSLHTTLTIGKKRLEIQIRTRAMHEHAEGGEAAHWQYDEHKHTKGYLKGAASQAKTISEDKYVYAFSPTGDIYRLKNGATLLDFAFAIHTGVGMRTTSVKVNGAIAPLNSRLQQGDQVEVLTGKAASPKRDWLRFAVSRKATQRIRAWLKRAERDRYVAVGRELLLEQFKGKLPSELTTLLKEYRCETVDDLLVAVGTGQVSAQAIKRKLYPPEPTVESPLAASQASGQVVVAGMSGLQYRLAECCHPQPPAPIIGFITRSLGITVHVKSCRQLSGEEERVVACSWR